jgi:hypothetical protein
MMVRALVTALVLAALGGAAEAQTFTPQSPTALTVRFQVESIGGARVLVFGEVKNDSGSTAERVVVLVQGLSEEGRVVASGRAYVYGTVAPKGSTPFEARLVAGGPVRRWRAQIESFQFVVN